MVKNIFPIVLIFLQGLIYSCGIWEMQVANSKDDGGLGGLNETISSLAWMVVGLLFTFLIPFILWIAKRKTFKGFLWIWFLIAFIAVNVFLQTV